ncbi:MAG: NAD-binding protein [Planctomycetota bacterium]|nr:NAD-binding protein [Planctomycetota bacterium]
MDALPDYIELESSTGRASGTPGAKRTVARVEHRVFLESGGLDYGEALGIDGMICPDLSTAHAIARVLRNPRTSAIEDYGQDSIEIHEFIVREGQRCLNTPLKDLNLPKGSLLAAVSRGGASFVPNGESTVLAGDTIVLVGNEDVFQEARRWFDTERERHQQIVIMYGTPIAVWLCRSLKHRRCSIRLFEPNRERAAELGNKLDWVTVVQEDIVDPVVFEEEKVDQADVFIACGDDDEQNILSCLWAKNKGTRRVITVSGRSDYLSLLKQIGIDHAFSPRNEAAEEIQNFLLKSPLCKVGTMSEGTIDVYRVPVGERSETVGKSIAEVGHPNDWIIALLRRADACFVPTAADVIQIGDTLLIVGGHGLEPELAKLFHSMD